MCTAPIADAVADIGRDTANRFFPACGIHAAPEWLWLALVKAMLAKGCTAETTRAQVARSKDLLS